MEFGWGRQQSSFYCLPNGDGGINQIWAHLNDLGCIFLGVEKNFKDFTVDIVDSLDGGRCHIDGKEMTLKSRRNVISTTSGMVHGGKELKIFNHLGHSSVVFIQEIDSSELHQLPDDFKCDLVAPKIYEWHR